VQVGRAIIRVRPAELAKTLRRFKGSKQIKKPTDAQLDKSQTITKDLGNFNKADRKIVAKADKARPSIVESLTGTGRGSGQKIIKEIKTGESRRNTVKTVASGIGGSIVGAGGTYMLMKDKDKKVEKKNTDGPNGKPKSVPKGLRESIAKDKKKAKPTPKKKPVAKNKVEEKKKKQLMMKEKYTGKDSNVKFNSRGGMLKKGKK